MKILLGCANAASFIDRDARILRERHEVTQYVIPLRTWLQPQLYPLIRDHDVLILWFATARSLALLTLAKLLNKPVIVIVGGYEAVCCPEIGYGTARHPIHRRVTQWILSQATRVVTVSRSSQRSLNENFPIDPTKLTMIHHGFEDLSGTLPPSKRAEVLTVGNIERGVWQTKGLREFFMAAVSMPDVQFVHAGAVDHEFIRREFGAVPANIKFMGRVSYEEIGTIYAEAKVYLQPSRHESFGCSVAEAMLFGCIPVVSNLFALPEVVGDTGIVVSRLEAAEVCAALRVALAMPASQGELTRRRVLSEFSYQKRRDALLELVDGVMAAR